MILYDDIPTPLGTLRVAVDDAGVALTVRATAFVEHFDTVAAGVHANDPEAVWHRARTEVSDAVAAYFDGDLDALAAVDVAPQGTAFQRRVWSALRQIPAGQTRNYRDIAGAAGAGRGYQAVGQANGRNPVWLIVPCHRVVQTDGSLGGYAGGVDRKRWLLDHEGALVPR